MIDAIVTGFAKSRELAEMSLAPLRGLQQEGLLRNILCVTWDSASVDAYAEWIGGVEGVALARVAQPDVAGTPNQRGVVYQIDNLRAALALLSRDCALVLKTRPDYVLDTDFLRAKLAAFDDWSIIPPRTAFGTAMPKAVFERKLWIPWADSNQPFYYEDAAFIGRPRDVARLATALTADDRTTLGDETCGSFVHALRYAKPFLTSYPLFAHYLKHYRRFASDVEYRRKLVPHVLNDGFFWHLLIAHAFILHSHFHVDAGRQGDLSFYSNTANPDANWSKPETLRLANPYDNIETWRSGTRAGEAYPGLLRHYGRLVDDGWQHAFFTAELPDFPRAMLVQILQNIAGCRDGRLSGIEDDFYRGLANFHAIHGPKPQVARAS